MNSRSLVFMGVLALGTASAQSGSLAVKATKTIPRMSDGHPDLRGFWSNVTLTPLERPRDLAGKEFFTEQEAAEDEKASVRNRDIRQKGTVADVATAYNDFWWDSGTKVVKTRRTSLVVDPPDGRIPPLTAAGRERQTERTAKNRGHEF